MDMLYLCIGLACISFAFIALVYKVACHDAQIRDLENKRE